jgi:hypothetical protein
MVTPVHLGIILLIKVIEQLPLNKINIIVIITGAMAH